MSVTPSSEIVSAAFEYSHLVFASCTYNGEIFISMDSVLRDIASHNLQNRTIAFMENGSWAATSGRLMKEIVSGLKDVKLIETTVSIKSALTYEQVGEVERLAEAIAQTM